MTVYKPLEVYKLAVDAFGEDRVDLGLMGWDENKINESRYTITIYFPEIVITNKDIAKHTIQDIYVKLIVSNLSPKSTWKSSMDMQGLRATLTAKEALSGYGHSHLSNHFGWGSFCLGSGNFAMVFESLRMNLEEEDWNLFFLSLENYLNWESIEGTPYRYLNRMGYGDYNRSIDMNSYLHQLRKGIPLDSFAYTNELILMEDSKLLSDYYNEKSPVKSTTNLNNKTLLQLCKGFEIDYCSRVNFQFLDRMVTLKVVPGEELKEEDNYVSRDVINAYNRIIKDKLTNFNKELRYKQLQHDNKEKLFGKALSFQQT